MQRQRTDSPSRNAKRAPLSLGGPGPGTELKRLFTDECGVSATRRAVA